MKPPVRDMPTRGLRCRKLLQAADELVPHVPAGRSVWRANDPPAGRSSAKATKHRSAWAAKAGGAVAALTRLFHAGLTLTKSA